MLDYPDDEYARTVCKIGKREECCRYLTMGRNGWSCEKKHPEGKVIIDRKVAAGEFTARGDNCEGLGSR